HCPMVVLQRAGNELGLSRRAAIYQCHERQAFCEIPRGGADPLDARRFAPLDDDNVALVDEGVGYGDRGVEKPSRVVPQIEDEAAQPAADLLPEILHRGGECSLRSAVEPGDAEIT